MTDQNYSDTSEQLEKQFAAWRAIQDGQHEAFLAQSQVVNRLLHDLADLIKPDQKTP